MGEHPFWGCDQYANARRSADVRRLAAYIQLRSRTRKLYADVSHADGPIGLRGPDGGRNFAHFRAVRGHLGTRLRHIGGIDLDTNQFAVDMAAGPYPLHDFLPEVTTLRETHAVHLPRFLRKCGIKNIFAVSRLAVLDAHNTGLLRGGGRRAGRLEPREQFLLLARGCEDAKTRLARQGDRG